jgi:hypothetical protein
MEIPSTPQSTIEAPVILQPDAQSNELRRLANAVPLLAFWARQAPNLPKPPRKQLIVPGRTESPAPPPQMAAPPVIAIPNREVLLYRPIRREGWPLVLRRQYSYLVRH